MRYAVCENSQTVMSSISSINLSSRNDQTDCTPQLSKTQSFSIDGTELVTQEFMVSEQLEQERIRVEEKKIAFEQKIKDYRRSKFWLVLQCA